MQTSVSQEYESYAYVPHSGWNTRPQGGVPSILTCPNVANNPDPPSKLLESIEEEVRNRRTFAKGLVELYNNSSIPCTSRHLKTQLHTPLFSLYIFHIPDNRTSIRSTKSSALHVGFQLRDVGETPPKHGT